MRRLLIENSGDVTELALTDEKALIDFWRFSNGGVQAEQIYYAVVDRIAKGMNAAFVKLTKDEVGYLPFSETKAPVKGGDRILVQVKKPPVQGKAAYLTQDIALADESLIYLPCSDFCAVSSRVLDQALKADLLARAKRLKKPKSGLVLRHGSEKKTDAELLASLNKKVHLFEELLQKMAEARPPCLLSGGEAPLDRVLRDNAPIEKLIVKNELDNCPIPYALSEHPFALYNVREQLKKALSRHVWLKSGGFLIIDPCEAMTVIDVNTGKFVGGRAGSEQTFKMLNLEAAAEIARLLRLRSMGGIIIIDFIDMKEPDSRKAVLDKMTELLKDDPVKCIVHGFTALGLMEITRKKTAEALKAIDDHLLCPHCGGTGILKEDV